MTIENLDYHFLKYMGVNPEGQRRIHSFYLPFFDGCHRVVDLGCGDGYFVRMLEEAGKDAVGVDVDTECCREAASQGLNVASQDVLSYLRGEEEGAFDGIFCSHLVEHLTFEQILELLSLCRRALSPGGTIVITTPNVRSLYSHLEMFYMHFGHVSFYHPNLLCFFLRQQGFSGTVAGENPNLTSLLLGRYHLQELDQRRNDIETKGSGSWWRSLRARFSRAVAGPYLQDLVVQLNDNVHRTNDMLNTLDCSFECYVKASR